MKPFQHRADDTALIDILRLIRTSFAYMDERIDPPSSMHRLTLEDIARSCCTGEVWSMGNPVHACMILSLEPNVLYLGRLAIAETRRKQGIGKSMIEHAAKRARYYNKPYLKIHVRIELTENHAYFASQGFKAVEYKTHPGYVQPTFVVMQRPVSISG